jgi:choline dehydrogenase-like flavoprotein
METVDVVVVGLGPTGLVLSLVLARLGVRVACVELQREPSQEPRAASVDDVAQRIMARECPAVEGLVQALRTQLVTERGHFLFDLPPHLSEAGHSDIGFFFQPHLEGRRDGAWGVRCQLLTSVRGAAGCSRSICQCVPASGLDGECAIGCAFRALIASPQGHERE